MFFEDVSAKSQAFINVKRWNNIVVRDYFRKQNVLI